MAKSKKQKADIPATSRRSFLIRSWKALGIVAFIECVAVAVAFLRPRKPAEAEGEFGGLVTTGPVDSFALNSVTAFRRGLFYLSRLEDGGFLALSYRCTHLGCTIPWVAAEEKFVCPCHSSAFDIRGNAINPPALRALDMYEVIIENNIVKVDTRKRIQRTEFREEQVVHPKKI